MEYTQHLCRMSSYKYDTGDNQCFKTRHFLTSRINTFTLAPRVNHRIECDGVLMKEEENNLPCYYGINDSNYGL